MPNGKELKTIAMNRVKVVQKLLASGDYDMAVYVSGYVLECALKAVICKTLKLADYPRNVQVQSSAISFHTHNFDILSMLAGMSQELSNGIASRDLFQNWSDITTTWKPELRYMPVGTWKKVDAEKMLHALTDSPHGVITYIKSRRRW